MYKIGELSRLCRIPVKTLRYYDNEGVLVPDEIDRFTGYRYYSAARIADCNRIIEYSCAVTPPVRHAGNHLSGLTETVCASLLA